MFLFLFLGINECLISYLMFEDGFGRGTNEIGRKQSTKNIGECSAFSIKCFIFVPSFKIGLSP